MNSTTACVILLFAGTDLDNWTTLRGQWTVDDGAIVCTQAPAILRSAYESDAYTLTFEFRHAGTGHATLHLHSRLSTGGETVHLSDSLGVSEVPAPPATTDPLSSEWTQAAVTIDRHTLRAIARRAGKSLSQNPCGTGVSPVDSRGFGIGSESLGEFTRTITPPGSRGFLRFQTDQPGLELRNIQVAEPGFTSLFDGQAFTGWQVVGRPKIEGSGWSIDDGTLVNRGHSDGWLSTTETYGNFILRLEYLLPPRGNSGVYVRAPHQGRISQTGMEIQLIDDFGFRGIYQPTQYTGSIYAAVAPAVRVPVPADEWNAIEISCDRRRVQTVLNSIPLYEADLDDPAQDAGSTTRPLVTRPASGYIGLQDHGSPARFRHLRVKSLP